jgi:hypothetical protein
VLISQVLLRHPPHLGQELLREDRDVGLGEPCRGEDIHDAFGRHGPRDDLPNSVVQFLLGTGVGRRALGENGLDGLEEGHVVPDGERLLVRNR